jgi:hypothetical protein
VAFLWALATLAGIVDAGRVSESMPGLLLYWEPQIAAFSYCAQRRPGLFIPSPPLPEPYPKPER